ncbi:MAG: glycosyltransferase family 4 protein [Chitinophagaceae bacterium]|nr:glycosyltransferase family 4 protein [Chitinophagaceae bacterium]
MKVVHVSFYYDETFTTEECLLEQHYTITGWAEALQRKGAEVIVISRFHRENSFQKNKVHYHFIKDSLKAKPKGWQLPLKLLKKISRLNADIVHLHHLTLSLQTILLRMLLPEKTAIVIQHHGGPLPVKKRRVVHNFFNSVADGYFFTTFEQGHEWFMNKKQAGRVMPVMEGATFFTYGNRDATNILSNNDKNALRIKTGMKGSPVFLWVGRLDRNKDPLTVLDGFWILLKIYPEAKLYMAYSDDKLANAVNKKVDGSPMLRENVFLFGNIPHTEIEMYYNAADYFVLGSHYEGSGYALSEALRCGCVPIITDIPSFRMMTNNGRLGALWEPGNSDSFVKAAILAIDKPRNKEANACIDFFKEYLSFDAIAGVAMQHYQKMIRSRSKKNSDQPPLLF